MSYSQARHEGFELNPYDTYIANKFADEKQCIIAWYVDGNKILQVDPEVVTGIVDKIEARFRKMIITRGKKHVFLRMHITYLDYQTVKISVPDYVKESIAELGENVNKTAPSQQKGTSTKTVESVKCSNSPRVRFSTVSLQSYWMYLIGDIWTFSCPLLSSAQGYHVVRDKTGQS